MLADRDQGLTITTETLSTTAGTVRARAAWTVSEISLYERVPHKVASIVA